MDSLPLSHLGNPLKMTWAGTLGTSFYSVAGGIERVGMKEPDNEETVPGNLKRRDEGLIPLGRKQ